MINFGTKGCMYCEGECNKECLSKEEPKQETLEEFIKIELEGYDEIDFSTYERFIELGAKWMQKRMYSEEEVINAFNEGQALNVRGKLIQGKEWFEQFKKK